MLPCMHIFRSVKMRACVRACVRSCEVNISLEVTIERVKIEDRSDGQQQLFLKKLVREWIQRSRVRKTRVTMDRLCERRNEKRRI